MTIEELLTAIDTWRAAYEEFNATGQGWMKVQHMAFEVTRRYVGNDYSYDALTTLAAEIRRLQATLEHIDARLESLQHVIEDSIKDHRSSHASLFLLRDIRNTLKGDE